MATLNAMKRRLNKGFVKGEQVGPTNSPISTVTIPKKFARKTEGGAVVKSVLPENQRQIAIKNHPDLFGKDRKDSFTPEDRAKRQTIIKRRLSSPVATNGGSVAELKTGGQTVGTVPVGRANKQAMVRKLKKAKKRLSATTQL